MLCAKFQQVIVELIPLYFAWRVHRARADFKAWKTAAWFAFLDLENVLMSHHQDARFRYDPFTRLRFVLEPFQRVMNQSYQLLRGIELQRFCVLLRGKNKITRAVFL